MFGKICIKAVSYLFFQYVLHDQAKNRVDMMEREELIFW